MWAIRVKIGLKTEQTRLLLSCYFCVFNPKQACDAAIAVGRVPPGHPSGYSFTHFSYHYRQNVTAKEVNRQSTILKDLYVGGWADFPRLFGRHHELCEP